MQSKAIIKDYIVFRDDEARIAGKPHLKAELVARMHTSGDAPIDYVMEHYGLTRAQVHAALAYYYENQQALDEAYDRSWAESRAIKSTELRAEIEMRQRGETET